MSGNERRYSSWTGLYATGVGGRDVGGKDRDKDSSSDSKPVDVGSATGMTDPVDWDATAAACTRPKSRNDDNRPSGDTSLYYQAVCLISGIGVERSYERGLAKMREATSIGWSGKGRTDTTWSWTQTRISSPAITSWMSSSSGTRNLPVARPPAWMSPSATS